MVKVQKEKGDSKRVWKRYIPVGILLALILVLLPTLLDDHHEPGAISALQVDQRLPKESNNAIIHERTLIKKERPPEVVETKLEEDKNKVGNPRIEHCPYRSISDLTEAEQHPLKSERHMVTPPQGGPLHLICCHTTKGPLNILVHEKWAPLGAQRVLEMVQTGYFNAGVPMMRCLKNFLCQFGLNNDPKLTKTFRKNLEDDPNWLPEGKDHRKNEDGVERFAHGYMAYAGGGKNSRTMQLIVSLKDVPTLAGGSPWEVPWGELVGKHSFDTLSKIYTGYGEKGPKQGKLGNQGMTEEMKQEFPELDYINSCAVVDGIVDS